MNLDELKSLNPRDIGSWPMVPKIGVLLALFLAVVFAGYWLDWRDQLNQLDAAKREEASLRETFLSKKQQAINLDTYRQQLQEIDQSFGALLKQLPNKSEMDALLVDINQAGLGRGLEFELFKPAQSETKSGFYAELPVTIKVTGGYHDLGHFASDIAQMPRIVTLNDVKIIGNKDGTLTMDAVAKTYRYLDESEVAALKKEASATNKGKGAKK